MEDAPVALRARLHARIALPAVECVAAQAQRHVQVVHGQRVLQLGGVFNRHACALGQVRTHGVGGVAQQRHQALRHLRRAGQLPLGGFAERTQDQLEEVLLPLLQAWQTVQAQHPQAVARVPLRCASEEEVGVVLEDWLDQLRAGQDGTPVWLELTPSKLLQDAKKGTLRADKLLLPWVRSLAAAASGVVVHGILVGRDATLQMEPLEADAARDTLADVLRIWRQGMEGPLPLALRTGLALVAGGDAAAAYEGSFQREGDVAELCLARIYPDFDALTDDGRFEWLAQSVCGPLAQWVATQVFATPHGQGGDIAEGAPA